MTDPGITRAQALESRAMLETLSAETQSCRACGDSHAVHYTAGPRGCVACEVSSRACPVYVPGPLPHALARHLDPVSADSSLCPWLCGDPVSAHSASQYGCLRCGCRYDSAPGARPPTGITYRGYPVPAANGHLIVVIEVPARTAVTLLPEVSRHSPDGFGWGYGGSGPAHLARSLLISALGPAAACPSCHGAGKVTWDAVVRRMIPCPELAAGQPGAADVYECPDCDDGYRGDLCYQEFKFEVVARWQDDTEWMISRAEILRWLAAADPGAYAAAIGVLPADA